MPYLPMYGFDVTFIILIPAMILAMYAQSKVKSTFNKYSRSSNRRGYTGKDLAEKLLRTAGIYDVRVEPIRGQLTDHYDPRGKVLRLSDSVYNSTSLAALGVAAHECGHAMQHQQAYPFITVRNAILPAVNISSKAAMPLVFIGFLLAAYSRSPIGGFLIQFGILLFSAVVAFQFLTLPVEFNASRRAITILGTEGYLDEDELRPAKKVLQAAALTYVAAAAVALSQLVRLLLLSRRRK